MNASPLKLKSECCTAARHPGEEKAAVKMTMVTKAICAARSPSGENTAYYDLLMAI